MLAFDWLLSWPDTSFFWTWGWCFLLRFSLRIFLWFSFLSVIVRQWRFVWERRRWRKGNSHRVLGSLAHLSAILCGSEPRYWRHYGFFCNEDLSACFYHGWTRVHLNHCSIVGSFNLFIIRNWHQDARVARFSPLCTNKRLWSSSRFSMVAIGDSSVFQ